MLPSTKNKYFLNRAIEVYGEDVEEMYDYTDTVYIKMKKPIVVRCKKHNVRFTQSARGHLAKSHTCKECRDEHVPRYTIKKASDIIDYAKTLYDDLDTYDNLVYTKFRNKITITCRKHGDYEIQPGTYLSGSRCHECGVEGKRMGVDEAKRVAYEKHGDRYTYNWSTYTHGGLKMSIKCPIHGWFEQRVNTHLSGKGCSKCGVITRTHTNDEVLSAIKPHFRDRYTYDKFVYVNDSTPVIVTCKKHGDFEKVPSELKRGNGCTKCTESKPERDCCNILDDLNLDYVQEYKIPDTSYRYDVYISKLELLIEVDGIIHYKPIAHYGGVTTLKKKQYRDSAKDALATKTGLYLIRIPYTVFDNMKEFLLKELSKIYKYNVDGIYYKSFVQLASSLELAHTITKRDVEKYLTYKG